MDKLQQIKLPIDKEFEEFRRLFDSSLQSSNSLLSEVLSYIKQRNGKMMRPILALLIAKLFGEINDSTLHAALSLELLHTASLVHDDVVDESDKRRGQSSVNAIYNNKVSVLVGDYMLATSLKHSAMTREITIVDLVAYLKARLFNWRILMLLSSRKKCIMMSFVKRRLHCLLPVRKRGLFRCMHPMKW
jgi:octaprenyl-diphosphate synthase